MKIEFAEGFQNSLDRCFHWRYAPLRFWKWLIRIPRELKWAYQRLRRGYSEEDAFSADCHIALVIVGTVKELIKNDTGENAIHEHTEEWVADLHKIVKGFEMFIEEGSLMYDKDQKVFDEGMGAFKRAFGGLWW